jgi:hypothetical protein
VPDAVHHQQGGWSDIHAVSVLACALAADAALLPFRSRMRLSQPAAHGTGAVRDVVQHLTARSARRAGRHFSQEHAPLPVNECLRLASTFHSMHAIAGNLTPVSGCRRYLWPPGEASRVALSPLRPSARGRGALLCGSPRFLWMALTLDGATSRWRYL